MSTARPALLLLLLLLPAAARAAELEALCDGIEAANVWDSHGAVTGKSLTFYYAGSRGDFHPLGVTADARQRGERSAGVCLVKDVSPRRDALALPEGYQRVWWDRRSGAIRDGSLWSPVCPAGYVAVGFMVEASYRKPPLDALRCVRQDLTTSGDVGEKIYMDSGSRGLEDLAVWKVTGRDGFEELGAVFAARSHSPPEPADDKIRLIRKDAVWTESRQALGKEPQ